MEARTVEELAAHAQRIVRVAQTVGEREPVEAQGGSAASSRASSRKTSTITPGASPN
jgi:hypothetical protein